MADYANDAVLVTLDRVYAGKEGISSFFKGVLESLPNITVSFEKMAVADDAFLLQWSAEADTATVPHGVATFIIRDGLIQRQTEWMVIVPREG
jgi:hypothetical protein